MPAAMGEKRTATFHTCLALAGCRPVSWSRWRVASSFEIAVCRSRASWWYQKFLSMSLSFLPIHPTKSKHMVRHWADSFVGESAHISGMEYLILELEIGRSASLAGRKQALFQSQRDNFRA